MHSSARFKALVHPALVLLAIWGLAAVPVPAESLTFHWDRQTDTTVALVEGDSGLVLAEFPWDGAVPQSFDTDTDEIDTPTLLLGQLRDQLDVSADPEAAGAAQFVRQLMGPFADTPAEDLKSGMVSAISYEASAAAEWCGAAVDADGTCVNPQVQNVSAFCHQHACKATRLEGN